jgi:hypothetical protein
MSEPTSAGEGVSIMDARYVEGPHWTRLTKLLKDPRGGTIGLSGPRGIGKTETMKQACHWAREQGGLGVIFPSPSEYEPFAFIAALSDVLAAAFEDDYDQRTGRVTRTAWRAFLLWNLAALLSASVGIVLLWAAERVMWTDEPVDVVLAELTKYVPTAMGLVLLLLGLLALSTGRMRLRRARMGEGRVREQASELRRQVRYSTSLKEATERGVGAAKAGVSTGLNLSRERELIERPATLSTYIHNLRSFAAAIPAATNVPLVLAIDELDKLNDSERAIQLLRDVKAVFDIDGVHVIVSISDEAALQLELGSVRGRNEFNSSFGIAVEVRSLTPERGWTLADRLPLSLVSENAAYALTALAGGVPRELVRMLEIVSEARPDECSAADAMTIIALEEMDSFHLEVLRAGSGPNDLGEGVSEADKISTFRVLRKAHDCSDVLQELSVTSLQHWTPRWASTYWVDRFQEQWRCLIVRLVVANVLKHSSDGEIHSCAEAMLKVVKATHLSAHVGLEKLLCYLISEAVPEVTPSVDRLASVVVACISADAAKTYIGVTDELGKVMNKDLVTLEELGLATTSEMEGDRRCVVEPDSLMRKLTPGLT